MSIVPGKELEFEAALEQAKKVISQAEGMVHFQVSRGIERPSTYQLMIGWKTLEDHTVGFRESELFVQWRGLIGPFFAEAPVVEHWQLDN